MDKKRFFAGLVTLCVVCALLFTVSCTKPKVKEESATMETVEALPAQETEKAAQAEQSAAEQSAAEQEAVAAEQAAAREAFVNEDIHFDFDKATLTSEAREILKRKAKWLEENPDASIVIEGHCDERGTTEYNLALGDRRAKAARDFLVDLGISASRIDTISYGEERPLDPGHNEAAWAKNRRAHFVIR
ncbi:MAG: peptidoglycan-associated lipoprotein [Desulfococcus sp. 4484_241]|nr:MAG: peptidoglycan-associated lipoprotein [Desulfococcus sp. 4484_241]